MEIDWRIFVAAVLGGSGPMLLWIGTTWRKQRQIHRLEAEQTQTSRELLRMRSEHAKELAELQQDHAKEIAALQGTVNDLTALHKQKTKSPWEGWSQPRTAG